MNSFVIDTYAWIEYFDGTKKGEIVKDIIENENNQIFTNIITIAELSSHYKRNNMNFEIPLQILKTISEIFYLDLEFTLDVGKLHAELKKERRHIGLANIFILLTAKKTNSKVVTGNEDFRGLKETLMIK